MLRLVLAFISVMAIAVNGNVKYCAKGTGYADGNAWMCLKFLQDTAELSWDNARAKCVADGGWLATINSAEEQAIIKLGIENNSPVNTNWWIGLNDKVTEGTWQWIEDNSQATYTAWYPGEPNSSGSEDCGEAYNRGSSNSDSGKWNDVSCTSKSQRYHYVCQFPDFTPSPTFSPSFPPSPVPTFQPTGPTGQPSGQPTSNPSTSSPTSYMKRSCAVGTVALDCREQNSVCLESECVCSPGYYFDGADGGKCVESPGGYIPLAYKPFVQPEVLTAMTRLTTSTDFQRIAYLADGTADPLSDPSLMYSLDVGKTWTQKATLPGAPGGYFAFAASDDFSTIALGTLVGQSGGYVYVSYNLGDSWNQMESTLRTWVYFVALNGDISNLYGVVHTMESIFKSDDEGETWSVAIQLPPGEFVTQDSVTLSSDASLAIVTDVHGHMGIYNQSSKTNTHDGWKMLTVPHVQWYGTATDATFTRIVAVGNKVFEDLNREPQIYLSENQGTTWTTAGPVSAYLDVKASASFDKLIVTNRGAQVYKYTQYGCVIGEGYSQRMSNVGQASAGMIPTFHTCALLCKSQGYPYFGLECPMATATHCQCYSLSKLQSVSGWSTAPKNMSCKNSINHCSNNYTLSYDGQQYELGGASVGSVYSTTDEGYSNEAAILVSTDKGLTWKQEADLPMVAGTAGGGAGLVACEPGTFAANRSYECSTCAKGSYTHNAGMAECVLCSPGKYGPNVGAVSALGCKPCALGTYSAASGADICTAASPGRYVPSTGSNKTTLCPAGRYSEEPGGTKESSCLGCPLGKNSSTAGATLCTFCPGGHYTSSKGTRMCKACPGGTAAEYLSGQSEDDCLLCEAGKYSPEGTAACLPSPPGTFTLSGSTEPQLCPAGTYADTGGGGFCRICPISTYASTPGASECTVCPPGRITPEKGSVAEAQCVSPESNFVTAIITLILVVGLSYEYVLRGRFQLVGFLRRERVYKPLTDEALGLATYLYRYIYKAEAQRVYLTGKRILRVSVFLVLGTFLSALFAFVAVLLCFARVVFKAMIVVVGLKMDLPFLDSIKNLAAALVTTLSLPLLKELAELFVLVITFFAKFEIDLDLINLTCAGATAPLKLLTNVCIVGVIIIVVEAEFPFLNSVTVRTLTTKFYRIVVSINYIPWSPTNFSRLRKQYFLDGRGKGKNGEINPGPMTRLLAPFKACKAWMTSFFPPTAFLFSFHYLGVVLTSLASSLMQATDIFQTVLQYVASRVRLLPFIEVHGVMHTWDDNCNYIAGFPHFDTAMAVLTSVVAWLLLLPALYCVSEILIPGIPPNMGPLENDIHHKRGATTATKSYRDYYKVLSIIAPDLWWAELTSSWGRYIGRHTPYDTGKASPSVHQVQRIATLEDVTVNPPPTQARDGDGGASRGRGRGKEREHEALLPEILRSKQTVGIMQQLEQPDLHTFRVKVEVNRDGDGDGDCDRDGGSAEAEEDIELSHPKPQKPGTRLRVRLFRCDRIISKTKVWTEIDVDAAPEEAGQGYFTLMKIEASTGAVMQVRTYGAWSLEYPQQTQMLSRDLRACTPNEVVLLVKWGAHEGHTSRLVEESLLKATKSEHFLSEEVLNVMHANTPSAVTKRKLQDPHHARMHQARATAAAQASSSGNSSAAVSTPATPPSRGTLALPPSTVPPAPAPVDTVAMADAGEGGTTIDASYADGVEGGTGNDGSEAGTDTDAATATGTPSGKDGAGGDASSPGSLSRARWKRAFKSVHHKVSTSERREFVDVMKTQALSGGSAALMELADAIAWVHGDSSTLPDSQAHFLIGLPVDAQMEELLETNEGFTGGYMRWVSDSGMVFCKAHDLQDDVTWKYPHLVEDGVLLDGVFSVGVVSTAAKREGQAQQDWYNNQYVGEEGEEQGKKGTGEDENAASDDLKAVWRLEEDPSVGYKSMFCIPKESYVMAPIRKRTDDENNAIHKRMLRHPPSYLRLCELEFAEMSSWPGLLLGAGLDTVASCLPPFVAALSRYLGVALCVLGLGHLSTTVGLRAWYVVTWKYYRFMLLCVGYWSEDVVELYQVHAKLAASSIVWMHPFFRITRSHEFDRDATSQEGPITAASVRPPPPPPRKGDGVENDDSDSDDGKGGARPPTVVLAQSTFRTTLHMARYPRPTWQMLKQGKYREWWMAAVHHGEETESSRRLQETTLKVLYANDYAAGLRSIVATRSVILQLVPGLALVSVFCELTSSFPLFVFSRQLELSLPEIINHNATTMARDIEREFTVAANHIRSTELNEDDNVVPDYELEHLSAYEIKVMQEANVRARNKMRMCLKQQPLKVKEWAVYLRSVMLTFEQSRLFMFSIELFQFMLILWLLFGDPNSHKVFVATGLAFLFPLMAVKALIVYIGLGKALAITDDDLRFFISAIKGSHSEGPIASHTQRGGGDGDDDDAQDRQRSETLDKDSSGAAQPNFADIYGAKDFERRESCFANPMHERVSISSVPIEQTLENRKR